MARFFGLLAVLCSILFVAAVACNSPALPPAPAPVVILPPAPDDPPAPAPTPTPEPAPGPGCLCVLKHPCDCAAAAGYTWESYPDGDTSQVWLSDAKGKQIGAYSFSDHIYRPVKDAVWGERQLPPIKPPAAPLAKRKAKPQAVTYSPPPMLNLPSCSGSSCGSCSSGSCGIPSGRRR